MKRPSFLKPVLAEFGTQTLRVLDGADGLELSLERADHGRLTAPCVERLVQSLKVFFKPRAWAGRRRAICAIGLRGVSLRPLTLPRASRDELVRLVLLQIEQEFPLSPDELAWGYQTLPPGDTGSNRVLVAAIKPDLLQQYEAVMTGCGLTPVFTVAALQRASVCPAPPDRFAVLDLGRSGSELITFEKGGPVAARALPFSGESVTTAIRRHLNVSQADAEKIKLEMHDPAAPVPGGSNRDAARSAIAVEVEAFAQTFQKDWAGSKLYLTGGSAALDGLPEALARTLGPGASCERIRPAGGEGRSAAILGLQSCVEKSGIPPLVLARSHMNGNGAEKGANASWKWAALAAVLAVLCLALRHAEPLLGRARLNRQLAELRDRQARLPEVDRELGFLQFLRTNQPPYLALLNTFAAAAPAGTRLDSVSLNRRGDVSLRATMRNSEQVISFRSRLVESGQFASVVVDEQTPSPDNQKITVRITGQRGTGPARAAAPEAPGARPPAPTSGTNRPSPTELAGSPSNPANTRPVPGTSPATGAAPGTNNAATINPR